MLRKRHLLSLLILIASLFAFGLFYDWLQFRKGQHFDPFIHSEHYQALIVQAANAYFPVGDIEAYHRAAYTIAEFGKISLPNGEPSAWVTPGYPLVLGTVFKLFGYHFFLVVLLNAFCLALAYFFLIDVARKVFGTRARLFSAVLLLMNLRMSMFVGYVYTECLFVFCLSGAIWSAVRIARDGAKTRHWLVLGFACGYGTLVRPVFLAATAIILLYLAFNFVSRSKYELGRFAACVALAVAIPSLWVYRNEVRLGLPIVSTSSALALADGNRDYYRRFRFGEVSAYTFDVSLLSAQAPALNTPNPELTFFLNLKTRFLAWRSENPSFYYWLVAWRTKAMFSPYVADMSKTNQWISLFLWILTFPAAFFGMAFERRNPTAWMIFSIAVLSLILPALVIVGPSLRYQIPSQLLLSILAASFYAKVFRASIRITK